jgi:peptidoglycan/xylan/chitin deacetylase (PgdA/CDA1 family)
MYHSLSDRARPRFRKFALAPVLFAEQMAYLAQQRYTTLTVSQYVAARTAGMALPESIVVLTFDDGFADFYSEALPVLKKYGFVATLYVATAFVNDTSRFLRREQETARSMLTWDQLIEIVAAGIECGAHSHRHAQLDVLPRDIARDEIVRSKQLLEQKLSRPVASFAYPYGYYQAAVKHMVQGAGYSSACAVRYRMSSPADDAFALSRLIVTAETDLKRFVELMNGRSPQLHPVYERTRAWAWRCLRFGSRALRGGYRRRIYEAYAT